MTDSELALWRSPSTASVPDTLSDPAKISAFALQLRDRERNQIAMNFTAGNYELASTFVWAKTMALLKKQLGALGSSFIGELLQRSDIDEFADITTAISDSEAISLARDLGMLTPLQTMRLLQSQAIVVHFAATSNDPASDAGEIMTQEEAISCLRVCVQGVLGQENVGAAEDFARFRSRLGSETFNADAPEIGRLKSSPYFFRRTAISILLSLIKTSKGAQLEHAARNAQLIIPQFWDQLKDPERWQIGQTYAAEFSEGRKDAVKGLHAVLLAVKGFDYVPENLRSTTFARVASNVVAAHQAMNNFYNERAPMQELASLGSSIPSPALAACITAILCVKLGNYYGVARDAQEPANIVWATISKDRWAYYLDGRLEQDRIILRKFSEDKPLDRWMSLIPKLGLNPESLDSKIVKSLIKATNDGKRDRVRSITEKMYRASIGLN